MRMMKSRYSMSTSLFAQSQSDATKKAEAEMESAFGTVPLMLENYPEHGNGLNLHKVRMEPFQPNIPNSFRSELPRRFHAIIVSTHIQRWLKCTAPQMRRFKKLLQVQPTHATGALS
jgi:hypothetical protein